MSGPLRSSGGESVDFTCSFTGGAASFSWSATGSGTDELDSPASLDGETVTGRYTVIHPATTLSVVMPALVVLGAFVLGHAPSLQWPGQATYPARMHLLLVPPLIVWLGALALSRRGLARGLSTPTLLLGGYISFSLYMTHRFVYGFWRTGMRIIGIEGGLLYFLGVIGLFALCLVAAYAMWRWVEEPAREWMRRLIGEKPKPIAEPTLGAVV